MAANPGFQLSLDVKGRTCLVLGGEDEAAEKAQRLLDAGARVIVISPTLNETLRTLASSAKVLYRGRLFRATDTEGVLLLVNTLRGDPDFSRSLYDLAKKERFLLCSTDQPDVSTVMMPALVSRGYLRLAISTSGVAPALGSRLREQLGDLFTDEFRMFLVWLAAIRDETQQAEPDAERRRARLREAVEGFRLTGHIEYPKNWLDERSRSAGEKT
ncbi:MAG: precorrin-2 dehydrogenase/sirohydrochlorin ferrochelatase family protein [Nitrospiraceae bacterium]